MSQAIRAAARRAAVEGQVRRRREQAARDKRLERLAVKVLVAVGERDAAARAAEVRAGAAVRAMLDEGLNAAAVAQWCGDEVAAREVRRLARVEAEAATEESETGGRDPGRHLELGDRLGVVLELG